MNNGGSNKKSKGYGSLEQTDRPDSLEEEEGIRANDVDAFRSVFVDDMHESYISQIRQQANTEGPIQANWYVPRSRRRPMVRTKSESDFNALLTTEDVNEIRSKLIRHYGKGKGFQLKKVPKFTRKQTFALAAIALVDFTSFCAMAILAPFYPNESALKGVPTSISGFVFSIYALVVFLSSPIMGIIITHVGPKFMLIVGIILGGSCNILFGMLDRIDDTVTFITYCFAVRIFEALGAAMISTSCYTFVAQIFPDNLGSVLGILEIFVGLGLSVGPAIGGLLYDWGGYGLPFFSLGVVMLITIPVNIYLLPATDYNDHVQPEVGTWKLIKLPPVIIVSCVIMVVSNTWGFLDPTLEPHLREFDLSAKQLGLFFLLCSILYAMSSPLWGYVADKMQHTWILMVIGLLFSGVGLILLGPSPLLDLPNTIWLNVVALIVIGTSVSMALLPTFEALLDFAVEGGYNDDLATYGVIAGLWSSMYSLGEVIGPSLGGFLLQRYGFPVCSTVMAAMCVFTALLTLIYFLSFHPMTPEESSPQSTREKTTIASDSGISEYGRTSTSSKSESKSSSSSSLSTPPNNCEIVNEKSPLLSRSLNNSRNDLISDLDVMKRSTISAIEVPTDGNNSTYYGNSYSLPKILKNVSLTEFGAVEI